MNQILTEGVPAALATAVLYNIGPVLEARAARGRHTGAGVGFRLLGSLVRTPLWLSGFACELFGYGAQVFALTVAPLVLIEPIIASGIVVLVIGGHRVLGDRLNPRGLLSVLGVTSGVILLTIAFGGQSDRGVPATTVDLWLVTGCCAAGAAALVTVALGAERSGAHTSAALAFGLAAGVCYGVSSVATRQLALHLRHWSVHAIATVVTTPTPYLLVVFGVIPLALLQRGYQHGSPAIVLPLMTAVLTLIAVVAGVTIFGEDLPGHPVRFAAAAIGVAAVGTGVIGLFKERGLGVLASSPDAEAH